MPASTSQYVRNHSITVLVANWGVAQTHAHNLNDGNGAGYTPNVVHVDSAYVTIGATNYAINPKTVAITAVGAATITYVVGTATTALRDALTEVFGVVPTSLTFEVVTRFVHSVEIGTTATGDETIGVLAAGLVPIELAALAPSSTIDTIYVRADGVDTNTGRVDSAAGAYLTIQRACNDVMAASPLYHDIHIRVGAGTFAGNWTLEGVDCRNGASVYITGAAPVTPIANGTSTSVGAGVKIAASGHDHTLYRFTPDAAFGAALAAASIGRTLRIVDAAGTRACYATIGQLATGVAAANQVIDLTMDPVLTGAAPAWVNAAGVIFQVLDETAGTVTRVTGNANILNIKKSPGATGQGTGNHLAKHNLIGNIRFDTGAVRVEAADRFSFHGSRFENGLDMAAIRDCSNTANSVPINGNSRYWPASVWRALGYIDPGASGTCAETANAYGGCGYHVAGSPHTFSACDGTVQGLVMAPAQSLTVGANSDIAFAGISVVPVTIQLRGAAGFNYARFAGQLQTDTDGKFLIGDYVTWMAREGAVPDTLALNPVNLAYGMMRIGGSGKGFVILGAVTRLEGHNSAGIAANNTNYAIRCVTGGTLYMTGGHDADFYGQGGWLFMRDAATGYMSGNRAMAAKNVANATHLDFDIADCSRLRSIGDITHATADNTPGPLVALNWNSRWVHGNVSDDTGLFVIGNGAGGGIDCGAAQAILVSHGSHMTMAVPRVHNSNAGGGSRALIVARRSEFFASAVAGANSVYLTANAGAVSVTVGVAAAFIAPNPLVAVILNDLPGAPAGTEHLCYYNVE